jgi:hypothetical protein
MGGKTMKIARPQPRTKRGPGRPRKDAEASKALALHTGGMALEDAGDVAGVSPRTIRRRRAATVPVAPVLPQVLTEQRRRPAPTEPEDLDPLETLTRVQRELELDLQNTDLEQVVQRRGIAALLIIVAKATEGIRRGRPPADDEGARWKADADAVLRKIRAKLPELLAARTAPP